VIQDSRQLGFGSFRLPVGSGLVAYVAGLAVTALIVAASLVVAGYSLGSIWVVGALALVAAIAERASVRLSNTVEESVSLVPSLFVAVLFGPLASMIVAASSMLGDFRRPYMKWATYTSSRAVVGAVTGLVAVYAGKQVGSTVGSIALATTAGALAAQSLDVAVTALTLRIRRTGYVREALATLLPVVMASVPLYAPIVALLALAYRQLSPWTLPLFFIPTLAAQRLFVLYQEQRRLADDLVTANDRLERANLSVATALVATLDARDRYTAGHSAAVAVYARDIAARMGLSDNQQQLVHLCGLVHDIGKVGLPPGLLEKPGPLTLDERRQMETHAQIGEQILAKVEDYAEIASVVRHHHERVDGGGYPDGLVGTDIPLLSRIIAVADAYNAMTSDRPYRDAMPSRVARFRLAQAVESQFDTGVVAAFEAVLTTASESYRSGSRPDFSLAAQDQYSQRSYSLGAA
jgi:putative nucleotidyltransferase with HDIG domain